MFSLSYTLILLLILNALLSTLEIAFIFWNKTNVNKYYSENNLLSSIIEYFVKEPFITSSTILIVKDVVNIAFMSLCVFFLLKFFALSEFGVFVALLLLLIIFTEFIPSFLGRRFAGEFVLVSTIPIRFFAFVLSPFIKLFSTAFSVLSKIKFKVKPENLYVNNDEVSQSMFVDISDSEKIDEEQTEIINKVIDIREQRVYEAMTPRTEIVGVDVTSTLDEVIDTFINSGYSKILVYEENLDNIKGWIFNKDLFKQPESIQSIIRELVYVPETKKSLEMLNEFLNQQFSVAVVVDEFGGTAGLITVEDLIEELFGEIRDEYDDSEDNMIRKLDNYSFLLSGKAEIDFLNEEYGLQIPVGDYETIAGYIIFSIGRIPHKGECFNIGNYSILILRSDKTKIESVKLTQKNFDVNRKEM